MTVVNNIEYIPVNLIEHITIILYFLSTTKKLSMQSEQTCAYKNISNKMDKHIFTETSFSILMKVV